MELKKIELMGFKSFADKTEFTFEPGITAFVGPNGCGKSNVVDATRWVLGEQSAKSLRGGEMMDVIFNGTQSRRPLGYAEVSLTILNSKNLLPIDYEEVCVTRRLYRSGESEYLLNKQPCRLRDIKELFMDTGLGADAYSVIEQGKVEAILQANAKERRFIFEEAAGISKYKAKRKSAINKLERVDQDLLRIGDRIEEIQRRLRSIKLQASKARRYKERSDRLKELRVALSLNKYQQFEAQKDEITAELEERRSQEESVIGQIHQREAEIAELEMKAIDLDQRLQSAQATVASIDSQIKATQDIIAFNHDRIRELHTDEAKYEATIKDASERVESLKGQMIASRQDVVVLQDEIKADQEALQSKMDQAEAASAECNRLKAFIEQKKNAVIDLLQQDTKIQNEITELSAEMRALEGRKERLSIRQEEIRHEAERALKQRDKQISERNRLSAQIAYRKSRLSEIREDAQKTKAQIEEITENLQTEKLRQSAKESRRELLDDLEMRSEGVETGVKAILEEASKPHGNGGNGFSGVRGMVADLLKVDFSHALAIEQALGEKAQYIVVDSTSDAVQAISFLREKKSGRAGFLALERAISSNGGPVDLSAHPGVVGFAHDLIQFDPAIALAVEHLLGNTLVVEHFDAALYAAQNGAATLRMVTLRGETIEPGGPMTGGEIKEGGGLITRKSELKAIKEELAKLGQTIESLEEAQRAQIQRANEIEQNLGTALQQIGQARIEKASMENEIAQYNRQKQIIEEESALNDNELAEIELTVQSRSEAVADLRSQIEDLRNRRAKEEGDIQAASAMISEKDELSATLQSEVTAIKVDLAQKEQKKEGLESTIAAMESDIAEREQNINTLGQEIQRCRRKRDEAEREIRNREALLKDLLVRKDEAGVEVGALRNNREEIRERVGRRRAELSELERQRADLEDEIHDLKLKENECSFKMENIEDRMREDYHVELSNVQTHSDGQPACRDTDGLPVSEDTGEIDWEEVEQEVEVLRAQIERMGNVNLQAIEEQSDLEMGEAHLTKERQDLLDSQKALQEIIKKVNRESRRMFEETFNSVRENFQVLFRKLFGGGKADVFLEEGVDILEAGIEIIACPPGKEPRSISLLSGGEKTMTTVALLFAIFKSKPSPFCLLDEVDAALDESNVDRFVGMVEEFTTDSQFIVMTHNKRTMSVADVIYGITMQESGVSKKISMKFEEVEQRVA